MVLYFALFALLVGMTAAADGASSGSFGIAGLLHAIRTVMIYAVIAAAAVGFGAWADRPGDRAARATHPQR